MAVSLGEWVVGYVNGWVGGWKVRWAGTLVVGYVGRWSGLVDSKLIPISSCLSD